TTIPTIELSGKIAQLYHDKDARVFFVSGGSEAVETAVKMAKKYQMLTGKPRAYKVISRRGSYHGATAMAVSLGRAAAADPAGPEMVGAVHVANYSFYRPPFDGRTPEEVALKCANDFETAIVHQGPETVAAMIAEPVSQMAGIHVPPPVYWQRLREIADRYNVVLIADEVITGFGRLGEWFGMMAFGVEPDISAVAKALTSGYAPLAAAIATKRIADAFIGGEEQTFRHIITFGGLPGSTAAALANLAIYEREDLVGNAKRMGEYLAGRLQELYEHPIVGDVRGLGLLQVVELVADRETKERFPAEAGLAKRVPALLAERGLHSFRAGDLISFCPPLCITKDEVDFMASGVDAAIGTIERELGVR
ncbi:MAG: aspartate aminotransferase family protein, partial [Gemmatimonadetes bacterium]|nr:aspartate aminotransferase family protein [Gemmatimonadota bacterium]